MKRVLMMLSCLLAAPAAHAATDVKALLECMRANIPAITRVQNVELLATDHVGTIRTFKGKMYLRRDKADDGAALVRTMLRIDEPLQLAGAAYLVRTKADQANEGIYVYMPAVKRVRRVSADFADGSLLGTNFSYNDLKQMANAFGEPSSKVEGEESIDGRKTQVLSFSPNPADHSRYTSVRTWIDGKTCLPLRAQFYDGSNPVKQFNAAVESLRQSGKYWYASEVEMLNLEENTRSVMRFSNVTSDANVPNRIFDPTVFYLAN